LVQSEANQYASLHGFGSSQGELKKEEFLQILSTFRF